MQNRKIEIYSDGSCLGNPGPGGWAAIIIEDDKQEAISGNAADTTNNRMEMMAIIEALKWVRKNNEELSDININIYSDSNLIIQTINQGWKKKANTDLWAEMDMQRAWLNISWNWVKGHHTNKYNNQADELAVKRAKEL